jgi:plasmid stability protein
MPNVLIRNIDEKTLENLKKRADNNNRSLQAELKTILDMHGNVDFDEARMLMKESIEKYKSEGKVFSDSVDLIREDRDR